MSTPNCPKITIEDIARAREVHIAEAQAVLDRLKAMSVEEFACEYETPDPRQPDLLFRWDPGKPGWRWRNATTGMDGYVREGSRVPKLDAPEMNLTRRGDIRSARGRYQA